MVVTLGPPRVRGIVHGDLFEVEVPVHAEGRPWPDEEWVSLFREYTDFPSDLEEPRLEHGRLRFEAREHDLRRAWAAVVERVGFTNRTYGTLLAPRDSVGQRGEDA